MSWVATREGTLRLLIADDHAITRHGIRLMADSLPGVEVVGEAMNGTEAIRLALDLRPDIVLMDVSMPETDGIEAIRRLRVEMPDLVILVLTVHEDSDTVYEAIRAGASGFLPKSASLVEIRAALLEGGPEGVYVAPAIAGRLVRSMADRMNGRAGSSATPARITSREREVLAHLGHGLSARSIGMRLGISERTVNTHVGNIYRKLDVDNRVDALREGMRIGLIELPR